MACVFGEMRTLKTSERWWSPKSVPFRKVEGEKAKASSVLGTAGECPSYPLCRVQPIAFHQSRSPLYSPSRDDPCTAVCHSPPRPHTKLYLALLTLTLSRSISFSH